MFTSSSLGWMHLITGYLLEPVVWLLLLLTAITVLEVGCMVAERFIGLKRWRNHINASVNPEQSLSALNRLAVKRIERSDFLTRIAPMLGLMGTLIPLGPGLAALGDGELSILTTAMSVAFDTTVLGLLVGICGFVMGRLRRRWYDELLTDMEAVAVAVAQLNQPATAATTMATANTAASVDARETTGGAANV